MGNDLILIVQARTERNRGRARRDTCCIGLRRLELAIEIEPEIGSVIGDGDEGPSAQRKAAEGAENDRATRGASKLSDDLSFRIEKHSKPIGRLTENGGFCLRQD